MLNVQLKLRELLHCKGVRLEKILKSVLNIWLPKVFSVKETFRRLNDLHIVYGGTDKIFYGFREKAYLWRK